MPSSSLVAFRKGRGMQSPGPTLATDETSTLPSIPPPHPPWPEIECPEKSDLTHSWSFTRLALLPHQIPRSVLVLVLVLRLRALSVGYVCTRAFGVNVLMYLVSGFVAGWHEDEGGLELQLMILYAEQMRAE